MYRLVAVTIAACCSTAHAQDAYEIGSSVGLSGYVAVIDRPWKDGVALAAEAVSKGGGVLGHGLQVVAEDMRSEPAEAVTAARKLINSDKVIALINGCSSAGNAAMAPLVARAAIPMMLCSILPPKPDDQKWAFSYIPPPIFDIETRYAYLQKAGVKKVGVLYDPTPYAGLQKRVADGSAAKFGLTTIDAEQFNPSDADMSAYVIKLNTAGAEAIMKLGSGSATITVAKAIKQLGLTIPLLASTEDLNVVRELSAALGDHFLFPGQRTQVVGLLPKSDSHAQATVEFLTLWQGKYGDRDPTWAARGWDALQTVVAAIRKTNTIDGTKLRDAIEDHLTLEGASGDYTFTAESHMGVQSNPYYLATMVDDKVKLVQ